MKWMQSIRAWSVLLTFFLVYLVIILDKLTPEVANLVIGIVGLVIGSYFSRRDVEGQDR